MKYLLLAVAATACATTGRAPTPSPSSCDASGVWRVTWSEEDAVFDEVTFDPARLRVEWPERPFGREARVTAVDVATCRGHVVQRWENLYGAEGYEDNDVTLRYDFALADGPQAVRGVRRRVTLDPQGIEEIEISATARRQDDWSEPATPPFAGD